MRTQTNTWRTLASIAGLAGALAVTSLTGTVQAQPATSGLVPGAYTYPPAVPYATGNYHHASTIQEGYFRGAADVIRAQGEAAYNYSLAAIHAQEARRAALENRKKEVETYFQVRGINHEARFPQVDPEENRARLERVTTMTRPPRLTLAQYRPDTGELFWPSSLMEPQFDHLRLTIDSLARRGLTSNGPEIADLTRAFIKEFGPTYSAIGAEQYVAGRTFLRSLEYAARNGGTGSSVAMVD